MAPRGTRLIASLAVSVVGIGLLTAVTPGAVAAEQGTALPAAPSGTVANGVAYVGDAIFASFRPADSPMADGVVHRTPADGSGTWAPVTAPGSEAPLTAPTDGFVARGDAILLPAAVDDPATPCDDYRLVTPTEERALESCGMRPVLGHGGLLTARRVPVSGLDQWVVERVADGTYVMAGSSRPAIDGDIVWQRAGTRLVRLDTASETTTFKEAPGDCTGGSLADVVGRFALVLCNTYSVVVDTVGSLTPRALPPGPWSLGDGFAYDVWSPDPDAPDHRVVRVIELALDPMTKTYGWSSHNGSENARGAAEPDDSGGSRFAMLTESGEVQRVDLSWVGSPPLASDDMVPPVLDGMSGSPAMVHVEHSGGSTWTPVTVGWTGHDPGDNASLAYDLRAYHDADGVPGPFLQYAQWKGRLSTSVVFHEPGVDTTVCFQVRARDWVGNLTEGPDGGWGAPRCTRVVSDPPTAYAVIDDADRFGIRDRLGPSVVTYRYTSRDDFAPHAASYDVAYQRASPGEQLGSWVSPAPWQHTTATSVSQPVPAGGQSCFRVRGRDSSSAGAYSAPWCISIPYDDRDFRIRDGAKRVRLGSALGHTATKLWNRHGVMVRKGVRGRQVWVRVVGGDPFSCAEVTLGRRHARGGCWTYELDGTSWQQYKFRPGSHGRLRIRGAMRVDAVAVVR